MPPPEPAEAPALPRRRLLAGAAGAGLAAGLAVAWWVQQRRPEAPAAPGAAAPDLLWRSRFEQPAGGELVLAGLRGKPLLLNFWATWCPPCIEELPLLDSFFRQNAVNGWQVVGLAIDQPSAVRKFLANRPLAFPIGLAGLEGTDLARALGNLAGGLPFTLVLSAAGEVVARRMGQVHAPDLAAWKDAVSK